MHQAYSEWPHIRQTWLETVLPERLCPDPVSRSCLCHSVDTSLHIPRSHIQNPKRFDPERLVTCLVQACQSRRRTPDFCGSGVHTDGSTLAPFPGSYAMRTSLDRSASRLQSVQLMLQQSHFGIHGMKAVEWLICTDFAAVGGSFRGSRQSHRQSRGNERCYRVSDRCVHSRSRGLCCSCCRKDWKGNRSPGHLVLEISLCRTMCCKGML